MFRSDESDLPVNEACLCGSNRGVGTLVGGRLVG